MASKKTQTESEIQIVVLQRGWVAVGRFSQAGDQCVLTDAHVIRRWGTSKGLGELRTGPTKNTVLDKAGTLRFHALTIVTRMETEGTAWASAL